MSDHTVKIRRPREIRSKPPSSSDPSRHRSSSSESLSEKIDHLTSLVLESNSRLDRLEALVLRLIPGDRIPSPPEMDTEVHHVADDEDLVNADVHQGIADDQMDTDVHQTEDLAADDQVDTGMGTDAHTSEAEPVSVPEEEGETEPLLDVDGNIQDTEAEVEAHIVQEVEPESEAHDEDADATPVAEHVADPEAEATRVVHEVLASLNAKTDVQPSDID